MEVILNKLAASKFRNSFHLNKKMKAYVNEKGLPKIQEHAYEIITKRLKPAIISNDGRQTPMRQIHPVFIAEHACACCCRNCLYKWHQIEKGRELTEKEVTYIVNLLMAWIKQEMK